MEKLPWNPSKDVIRVSANNLGIDIDRAIYTAMAIDYSRQSTEQTKKNDIVRLGMCNVSIRKVIWSQSRRQSIRCGRLCSPWRWPEITLSTATRNLWTRLFLS